MVVVLRNASVITDIVAIHICDTGKVVLHQADNFINTSTEDIAVAIDNAGDILF